MSFEAGGKLEGERGVEKMYAKLPNKFSLSIRIRNAMQIAARRGLGNQCNSNDNNNDSGREKK